VKTLPKAETPPPRAPKAPAPQGLRQRFEEALQRCEAEPAPEDALAGWVAPALPRLPVAAHDAAPAVAPLPSLSHTQGVMAARLQQPFALPAAPGGTQWSFALADGRMQSPLATLHVSGDAALGWHLRLNAGTGLQGHQWAAGAQRLRGRLDARGHHVHDIHIDEEDAPR
jgi:hypothetical protein